MARNVTVRLDDELVKRIDAVSDILQVTVSEFIREAARHELDRVRRSDNFSELVAAEKERQDEKFTLVEPELVDA